MLFNRKWMNATLALALFWVSANTQTLPMIQSIAGDVEDGNQITISGSGFGADGPEVALFDDFEGTPGGIIPSTSPKIGAWDSNVRNEPKYHSHAHSGNTSFGVSHDNGSKYNSFWTPFGQGVQELMLSYWVCVPNGYFAWSSVPNQFPDNSVWKLAWIYNTPTGYSADRQPDMCLPTFPTGSFCLGGNDGTWKWLNNSWWAWGDWMRVTIWFRPNTSDPTADGTLLWQTLSKTKGLSEMRDTLQLFKSDFIAKQFDRVSLPGWIRTGDFPNFDAVYDDVYLAIGNNAQARVEIGDHPMYDQCKSLSLLTPDSWNDTEIKTTVRQGGFDVGDTAYVFVINSDGWYYPMGKQVVFGEVIQSEISRAPTFYSSPSRGGNKEGEYFTGWMNGQVSVWNVLGRGVSRNAHSHTHSRSGVWFTIDKRSARVKRGLTLAQ